MWVISPNNKMTSSGPLLPTLRSRRTHIGEVPEALFKPVIFFQQPGVLAPFFKNRNSWNWGDGPVGKSACCDSLRAGFESSGPIEKDRYTGFNSKEIQFYKKKKKENKKDLHCRSSQKMVFLWKTTKKQHWERSGNGWRVFGDIWLETSAMSS